MFSNVIFLLRLVFQTSSVSHLSDQTRERLLATNSAGLVNSLKTGSAQIQSVSGSSSCNGVINPSATGLTGSAERRHRRLSGRDNPGFSSTVGVGATATATNPIGGGKYFIEPSQDKEWHNPGYGHLQIGGNKKVQISFISFFPSLIHDIRVYDQLIKWAFS